MDSTPTPVPPVSPMRPMPQPQVAPPVPSGGLAPSVSAKLPVANAAAPNAVDGPSTGDGPTIDEASGAAAVRLSIWQHPFVQNVLPFLTSLLLHAGIIILGIASIKVVQIVSQKVKDQVIIPDAAINEGPEGGIPHPGTGGDPNRDAAQDKFPDVQEQGIAENKNDKDITQALGGGSGEQAADAMFAGPNAAAGKGRTGVGGGIGEGTGSGNGEGGGPIAPFGVLGGGSGIGPKSNFIGMGGNARRIVFVLDATGSMMPSFDDLRVQLRMAVNKLQPPQSFNVVFIKENSPAPPAPNLLFVTPENKALVLNYVDKFAPSGGTDPLPALTKAFEMKPELIYFLIDPSDFPDKKAVIDLVHKNAGSGKVKMNIIAFEGHDPDNEKFLSDLAKETGGQFKYVSNKDLQQAQ